MNRPILVGLLLLQTAAMIACGGGEPTAASGVLDLRGRGDSARSDVIRLNGQWEFYWKVFRSPAAKVAGEPVIVSIPNSWTRYAGVPGTAGADGFATYRLRILLDEPRENMALSAIVSSASRIQVNGKLVLEVGRATKSPMGFRAHFYNPVSRPFRLEKENEIIIHAANFGYYQGGLTQSPVLGSHETLLINRRNRQWLTLLLVGSILFMGLYHVFLFVLNPGERSALYFAALCLTVSTRMVLVNERVLHDLIPGLPFEIYARVIFIATYGILLGFAYFVGDLYRARINRVFLISLKSATLLIMLCVAVLPLSISPHTVPVFGFLFACGTFYALYILVGELRADDRTALILIFAFIGIFISGINDLLFSLHVINTGYYTQYAFAFFVLFQSFIVSSRILRQLRESNERLLSLDKLKDDFLANTSHELRTPLQGIIGLADSLMDPNAEGAPRRVELIKESARRLSRLVNDILDFSKLRYHDLELNPGPIDLRTLTDLQLELISHAVPSGHSVRFINAVPGNLPPALGDEGRVTQILHNLLSNAVKYTREGDIRVEAERVSGSRPMLEIRVSDAGAGIASEDAEKIFAPFEQATRAGGSRGGTGLGLSIARSLAELHGGELRLLKSDGAGSVFAFTLPQADGALDSREHREDENKAETGRAELQRIKTVQEVFVADNGGDTGAHGDSFVLLVDDEPVNLTVMRSYAEQAGIRTMSAESAEAARNRLRGENLPACIVLDIMMPGISGLEFCRELRATYSLTELPVLLVTARTRTGDLVAGMEAGANDYLAKPFEKEEFLLRLGNLISLAHTQRDAQRSRMAAREIAQRVRADINADLHDHLGASLTDLKLMSEAAMNDPSVNPEFAEKIDKLVTRTALMLRSDLLTLEDLDLLEKNFGEGIHMILLRRYVEADREIEFHASGIPERAPVDDIRGTVLYAVVTEITTNDLKYGTGSPAWNFEWDMETLRVDFQGFTNYRMERHGTGRGTGSLVRRLSEIGGSMQMSIDTGDENRDSRPIRIAIQVPLGTPRTANSAKPT